MSCRQQNVTPVAKKRKSAVTEERPSRIGTRISPRTIQRQTGLRSYKDTSSDNASSNEDEDDDDDDDDANQSEEEQGEMDDDEEEDANEEEEEAEVVVKQVATPVIQKVAKKRGRKPKKRRPVKKKLAKIVEEEEESVAGPEVEPEVEPEVKPEASDIETVKKELKKESDEPTAMEVDSDVKPEVKRDDETGVKPEVETNVKADDETDDVKADVEADDKADIKPDVVIKKEESGSETSQQRFTVSQLLQKLSHDSTPAEEGPSNPDSKNDSSPADEETPVEQGDVDADTDADPDPDPDRCTYDPFVFELIISSVEELLQWINQLKEVVGDTSTKKRSSDAKLCDRLQALYDEAQPLAADQLDANEKIGQQLWKQWQRYRRANAEDAVDADEYDDSEEDDDADDTHHDVEEDDGDSSDQSDDGIRHSRRLRIRRAAENSHQDSTRSSSPADDDPAKVGRKGYNYDPGWMDSESPSDSRRKSAHFDPEMKKPQYWIGRRMTRAAAAFAGSDITDEPQESPYSPCADADLDATVDADKSATATESEPLLDQLRQLRRQQELLSSNDPKLPQTNGITSCKEKMAPASLRMSAPKASELLTKVRLNLSNRNATTNPSHPPRPSLPANPNNASRLMQSQQQQQVPSSTEKKIIIQISDPNGVAGSTVSLDITHVIQEAADKGIPPIPSSNLFQQPFKTVKIHSKLKKLKC